LSLPLGLGFGGLADGVTIVAPELFALEHFALMMAKSVPNLKIRSLVGIGIGPLLSATRSHPWGDVS